MQESKIDINFLRDHKRYLETFCKIKTKDRGLQPFILNETQKDLFNTLNKNNNVIILKARQLGVSTGIAGYFYVDTLMNPGTNSALIGYNAALTRELFDKIRTFHKYTPDAIKPKIEFNTKDEISFPKIDSKIFILPSTSNVGSGYTLGRVLLTELAKTENAEEKLTSLLPAIPLGGKLVIESSPYGVGNLFHRLWEQDNTYVKKKYGWWWGYSKEEIEEIKKRINDPRVFAQEYGLEFLSSGRCVFEQDIILEQRKNILEVNEIRLDDNFKVYDTFDGLRVYKEPEKDGIYCFGCDCAEGISGGDFSVAVVWDRRTGEEVAFFRSDKTHPHNFGELLNKWGRWYNNAMMVVEVESAGLTTINTLKQLIYPMMYYRPSKIDTIAASISDRLGWKTTMVTRDLLLNNFRKLLNERTLTIHSKEILNEMSVFIYDSDGNMKSQSSYHDDCIFAAGIGLQGFKMLYDKKPEQVNFKQYFTK